MPGNRRVFLSCDRDLQEHDPLMAICDFLQNNRCIITSTDDFLPADYDALYAAIEQCDVFICVLDKLIYSSQAFCLLIHACSLQRRRTTRRRLVTPDGLNYVVLFSPRVRHFCLVR